MTEKSLEARLNRAQNGDMTEILSLLEEYKPLIIKYSYINHVYSEDLFSELQMVAYLCIRRFQVKPEDWESFLHDAHNP